MAFIVNTTVKEYFVNVGEEQTRQILKDLLKPCDAKTALIEECIGESRWKRTDIIKFVSSPVLMAHVYGRYNRLEH